MSTYSKTNKGVCRFAHRAAVEDDFGTRRSNKSSYTDTKRFRVEPVRNDDELQAVVTLFYEYVTWLDLDLAFQGFDAEMQAMPGKYAPPTGELLLARNAEGSAVGCVALRPQGQDICEMKRLWVRDIAKGSGLGRNLVKAIIKTGRRSWLPKDAA